MPGNDDVLYINIHSLHLLNKAYIFRYKSLVSKWLDHKSFIQGLDIGLAILIMIGPKYYEGGFIRLTTFFTDSMIDPRI